MKESGALLESGIPPQARWGWGGVERVSHGDLRYQVTRIHRDGVPVLSVVLSSLFSPEAVPPMPTTGWGWGWNRVVGRSTTACYLVVSMGLYNRIDRKFEFNLLIYFCLGENELTRLCKLILQNYVSTTFSIV